MHMELTNCTPVYWEFIRVLRNDKRTRSGFIQKEYITKEAQEIYMKLSASNYKIALLNGSPVGYVGVIDNDIRVCTHPDYQGNGVGKFMIKEIIKIWPNSEAKIKINNIESIKLFEACGFKKEFLIMTLSENND